MTYAIALSFDEESMDKMQKKINEIADAGINPYMVSYQVPPHLTISLFEADNEAELSNFVKGIHLGLPKQLQMDRVDFFVPKVIYLSPKKSDYLIELNKRTTDRLIEKGISPDTYYLPDKWVPHIALGVQLTLDELRKAIKIVEKDFRPICATINKTVLAKCNPYKEIDESAL